MDTSFRKYLDRHVFPVNSGRCSHIAVTVAHHPETEMRAEKRRDDGDMRGASNRNHISVMLVNEHCPDP